MFFIIKIGIILIITLDTYSKVIVEEGNNLDINKLKNKNKSNNNEIKINTSHLLNKEIKYLPSNGETQYEVNNSVTIELIVLSGDAFFIFDNSVDNWNADLYNYANNQKLLLNKFNIFIILRKSFKYY